MNHILALKPAVLAAGLCLPLFTHPAAANPSASTASATASGRLAEEALIVTASREPRTVAATGSTVSLIRGDTLASRETPFLGEVLREVPGVAVNRAGPVGGLTQVRLRGAEGNHTLVLIDGIEANDPAFGSEFNFAPLQTDGIGRIEVLRGPQSALWGSDAIGGVISLHSALPAAGERTLGLDAAGGSQATTRTLLDAAAGGEQLRAAVSASRYRTAGVSASRIDPERDGLTTRTLHGVAEADLLENLTARLVLRQTHSEVEEDRQDFDFPATPTQGLVIDSSNESRFRQHYARTELRHATPDDRLVQRLAFGWTDTSSHFIDAGRTRSAMAADRRKFDYDATLRLPVDRLTHTFTAGVQHEALRFRNRALDFAGADQNRHDQQTSGIFEYGLDLANRAWLSIAARHDWNRRFADATTWRTTAAWRVNAAGTRLHASYGEGIANPGFFELFGFIPASFAGNPDLQPESSRGFDLGIGQTLYGGRLAFDLTAFHSDFRDEISTEFDFATFLSTPVNLGGRSRRTGVEFTASGQLHPRLQAQASYTFVDAQDRDHQQEVRRPRHSAALGLTLDFAGGRGNLHAGVVYNGRQQDSEFIFTTPADRVTLDDWLLANLAVSFDISQSFAVYTRIDNLLDADYSELFGFRSPGRTVLAGVRLRLD